jgi:hypothetical protein
MDANVRKGDGIHDSIPIRVYSRELADLSKPRMDANVRKGDGIHDSIPIRVYSRKLADQKK